MKTKFPWHKGFVEYHDGDVAYLSVAFTWDLPAVYQRVVWLTLEKKRVIVGGPAVALMPHYLADVAEVGQHWPSALEHHNPMATFTSRGCIRRCQFCAVWRTEGQLRELDDWPVRPVVCDNNLLACSQAHFDQVVDRLKPLPWVDFNQGLDARLLTKRHARRLAELKCRVRLALDNVKDEKAFLAAYQLLRDAGFAKRAIQAYVLLGFRDTPEDALYRLELVRSLGSRPNPMRYQPLGALARNSYIAPGWTSSELKRFTRYWSRLRFFGGIPFEDFR